MARPGTAWGTIRVCPYTLRATSDTGDNRKEEDDEEEEDDDEWDVSVPVSVVAVMLVVVVAVLVELLLMFITGQWRRNCARKAFS